MAKISFRQKKKIDVKLILCIIFVPTLAFIGNLAIKEEVEKSNQAIKDFTLDAMGYEPAENYKQEFENYKQEITRLQLENERLKQESKVSRGNVDRPSPSPASPAKEEFVPDKVIKSIENNLQGAFKGKAPFIYQKSRQYNVNPMLMAAIMKHETGNGSSKVVVNADNPGGLVWYEGCPYPKFGIFIDYPTLEKGIEDMVRQLKVFYIDKGLTSIEQIQKKYAPLKADNDPTNLNVYWTPMVTKNYLKILEEAK